MTSHRSATDDAPVVGASILHLDGATDGTARVRGQEIVAELRSGERSGIGADFTGQCFVGADLSGIDLTGARLVGCDLSSACLEDTRLIAADLSTAVLHAVRANRVELSGATLVGANLEGAELERAGLGRADLSEANLVGARLAGASLVEADLSRADLRLADLSDVRARSSTWVRANLARAQLQNVELEGSAIHHATFDGADLRRANLRHMSGFRTASFLSVDLRDVDFSGAYLCRSHIMDQNFLVEFRQQGRLAGAIYWLWWLTSDCGRSILRWTMCTSLLLLAFAWLYTRVEVAWGAHSTSLSPIYYSVVTLTTLGYGDVLPASKGAQIVAMAEVVTGYVMLGGLLSIFSNKMARRAE